MPAQLIPIVPPRCMKTGCDDLCGYEVHDGRGTYMGSYCSNHAHQKRDAIDAYDQRLASLGRESKILE